MKEIKVLGTGCSKCTTLYDNVKSAVAELGIDATVEKEQDIMKIMEYNVMSIPALVVDGSVLSTGKVLTIEDVKKIYERPALKSFSRPAFFKCGVYREDLKRNTWGKTDESMTWVSTNQNLYDDDFNLISPEGIYTFKSAVY